MDIDSLLVRLKALSDGTRLRIFKLVQGQELCVCRIVPAVGLSQPTVSVHLSKLRQAGLVRERRAGQWSFYSADGEGVERLTADLAAFLAADLAGIPAMKEANERLRAAGPGCDPAPEGAK